MSSQPTESMPSFGYPGLDQTARRRFEQFAEILAHEGRRFNLTAILEPEAVYLRHFADALQALDILDAIHRSIEHRSRPTNETTPSEVATNVTAANATPANGAARQSGGTSEATPLSLVDIGSGAGLPGLALAIARPDWHITSLEATAKKVAFQQRLIDRLGLTNAHAVHGRAEQWARDPALRESFHTATARALASLEIIAELALPLLRLGGCCIAYKTANGHDEIRRARLALEHLGGRIDRVINYSVADLAAKLGRKQIGDIHDGIERPTRPPADIVDPMGSPRGRGLCLIIIEKTAPTDPRWPRPWKQIKRRPIVG